MVKGYKAFNKDMTCTLGKGKFQYEIGKTYEMDSLAEARRNGFHFCLTKDKVYTFYPKDSIVCVVYALGDIEGDGFAYATNKIQIGERIN